MIGFVSNRFLLEMNIISPRHLLQGYLEVRRVVLPSPPHPLVVLHLARSRADSVTVAQARARSKILSSYVLLSTGNALVAGLRQGSKIYGPASLPPLVLAEGRAVRRVRVPGPGGGRRPLCGQRPPFHSQIPQLCFGFTILLISVLHTVGTWIGLPTYGTAPSTVGTAVPVQARSDYTRDQGQTLKQTKKKQKEKQRVP